MSEKEWEIFKEKVQPIKASGKVKNTKKRLTINTVQGKIEVKKNFDKSNLEERSGIVRQLDKNILRKIRRGNLRIQESLDLHGCTVEESKDRVIRFIEKNYENQKRFLLIITGKGKRLSVSDGWRGEGKLKKNVPEWLSSAYLSKYILWFDRATSSKGGDGALMVYLRKSKDELS